MTSRSNPFSDYGNRVYGGRFIDREAALAAIRQRVVEAEYPGCLAVVGPPRIGKSSLIWHSLMYPDPERSENRSVSLWLNLATIPTKEALLTELVLAAHKALRRHISLGEDSVRFVESVRDHRLAADHLYSDLIAYFSDIHAQGWRCVAVLDEFDSARLLFKGDYGAFQILRELGSHPNCGLRFVTASRRSVRDIEEASLADISNFHSIFETIYLKCFDDQELTDLLGRLREVGLELNADGHELAVELTGGHPYLASAIAYVEARSWLEHARLDLSDIRHDVAPVLLQYYQDLNALLESDGSLEKLLQIVFGPVYSATEADAEQLVRYGVLRRAGDHYETFSSHFCEYLRILERSLDLWPLWRETERRLRAFIDTAMVDQYKVKHWGPAVAGTVPKLAAMIDRWRENQARESRNFGARASTSLLDFSYPDDLYQIIRAHWSAFGPVFGHDERYWYERLSLLAKVRTPMAHNRDEALEAFERNLADGYCRELLHVLGKGKVQRRTGIVAKPRTATP